MPKALTVWITINWKILKEIGIPDHLTCILRNLYAGQEATELDMEQQTGSKLGKEYVKAVYCHLAYLTWGFPAGSEVKASASGVGDPGSIPGSGRSPGEGNGNPLQYSCLENPMDREAWQATVHRVAQSRAQLSDFTSLYLTYMHSTS